MIQEKATQVRVGIFLIVGVVLSIFILFMIGGKEAWFEKHYMLYCTFEDVSGLGPGAGVSLAGMRIGSVRSVEFSKDLTKRDVIVEMELSKHFQERIRGDSEVSIVTQGLLGDKNIVISVGTAETEALQDGDSIRAVPSGDLAGVGKSAGELVAEMRRVVDMAEGLMVEAKEGKGILHALLYDPTGETLLHDLSAGARSLRRLTERVEGEAGYANIGQVVANMEEASHDVKLLMQQIRQGEGTLGGLLTDDAIYNDLRSLFGKANRNVLLKSVIRSMLRERERAVQRP